MTADHDDRVVPAHSYKFAAAMQKAQGCANPVVLRVTPSAGHGAGKPTQRVIDDVTAKLAFIETALCGEPASDSAGVGS
jgi:prolyl oligopeptidase